MSKNHRSPLIALSSLVSGILLWLSWPERGFTPLIFVALVPLLFAEHRFSMQNRRRNAFRLFGNFFLALFTWNALTTWWIYYATDIGSIVAIALNSFFMTIIWQLFYVTKKRQGQAVGYFSLIFFWISFEYLHLNWEISWPWLTLGNVFATRPEWVQWYEYSGVLGGTLWVLIVNLLIFQLLKNLWYKDLLLRIRKINVFLISVIISLAIAVPAIFSLYIYYNYKEIGEPINVVLLQPNIDPYHDKFNGTGQEQLAALLRLGSTVIDRKTDYCLGPETALPDGIREEDIESDPSIQMIREFTTKYQKLNFILGLTTFKSYPEGTKIPLTARKSKSGKFYFDVFNAAMLVTGNEMVQLYHKSRLVPGVEKMPYPMIFGFLEDYAIKLGGTSGSLGVQENRTNFYASDRTRIAPAICYESIYGGFMSAYMRDGAEFIAIITNDGWWGNTPGYRQHMNYARLRAIEFRKSIARSANTGISCFINQRGDVIQQSEWWKEDALKGTIYKNELVTFYAQHPDFLGFISAFLSVTMILYLIFRRMIQWF
jgi:apolipoprotein N-acyltransferase